MKKHWLIMILLFSLGLVGCQQSSPIPEKQQSEYLADLVEYQDSYVGDNSAVSGILNLLWGNQFLDGFSLKTDGQPSNITVNYKVDEQQYKEFWSKVSVEHQLEDNAIILFSLVKNVDEVMIKQSGYEEKNYSYSREELEEKYGVDFRQLPNDVDAWEQVLMK